MTTDRMPVLFFGHGSPMNAIEDNEFNRGWIEVGRSQEKDEPVRFFNEKVTFGSISIRSLQIG